MIFLLILILFGLPNDICDGCNVGYYGKSCTALCPENCHDNECNATTGKCLSCVKGYYSNNTKDCVRCPDHCTACNSDKFCFACDSGFRGEVCEYKCTNCKPATSCDKNTGYCLESCNEGRSGELCNIQCDSKCMSCDRHKKDECISCADGHRTEKTCNQTDRVCVITCKELSESELQPDNQGSSTSNADIGLIVGVVIGSIIPVIIICVIVFIIVRRRSTERINRWSDDRNRTPVKNDNENYELLPRESSRIIETRVLPSAEKLKVLRMKGTFITIQEKFSDMQIKVAENEVTVEGDSLDIEHAFKEINSEYDQIEHLQCQHSKSRDWLDFYQKPQTKEYVKQKLKQKQLLGIWYFNGTELNVFVHGKGKSVDFKTTLLESVLEISDKENVNTYLLNSEWWGEFLIDIRTIFHEKVVIFTHEHQHMVIICTDDVVKQVTEMVSEFFEAITYAILCEPGVCEFVSKFWTQDDFDGIRKNGVKIKTEANKIWIRGLRENVANGKENINVKLKDICCNQKVLKKTGIIAVLGAMKQSGTISDIELDYRCVIKFQQDIDERPAVMLDDYEVIDSQLLEGKHQESCIYSSTICFQTRRHNIKIQLIQGDIVHQKVDIIVVGAASNLDLQSGSAFNTLLEQGGPNLKTDYNRRYPNGTQNGEVAVIDSGNFKCDKIYLTSVPPWKEASRNGGKVLRNFMRECLRLADKFDKKTIAFSIKVTWEKLRYPTDMVVSIMYEAVAEFDSSYSKTSLKEINIVDDEETIKTCIMYHLKQAREKRTDRTFIEDGTMLTELYEDPKYRMVKDGCAIGPIQLQVLVGDLLNCTTDAIVVEGGANIDSKENVIRNNGVMIRESAGPKAKHLIYVLLEDTLDGWRSKLVCCLEEAGKKDLKSVALPVFGLGAGTKTSPDGVGACLFAAIDDFTSQNSKSSVTDVRLVVPDSNAGCVPVIIASLQERTTAVNSRWRIGKMFKSQLGCLEPNKFKESSVTVYSDATINLERCFKALDERIGLEFAEKVVDVDMDVIKSLKDKQINNIIDTDIVVDVMPNKKAGQFTISGPLLNVLAAVACLQNKVQQYTRKENSRKSAKALYDQTRWNWLSENQKANVEVPYDMMTNYTIETAYKEKKQTVELQSKDGKIYVIDFQKLVEYPKFNVYDTVMVSRRKFEKKLFKIF